MIPVSVCAGGGPEVLSALPLIQHRCGKVNTLAGDPADFFVIPRFKSRNDKKSSQILRKVIDF